WDFFAGVSHELRSPLTSIRGAAELLREGVPGPLTDKQKRLTDIVSVSSGRLLRLVNQILEMSRLQAGLLDLKRTPLDLADLIDRAVEELHPLASEAGGGPRMGGLGTGFTPPRALGRPPPGSRDHA